MDSTGGPRRSRPSSSTRSTEPSSCASPARQGVARVRDPGDRLGRQLPARVPISTYLDNRCAQDHTSTWRRTAGMPSSVVTSSRYGTFVGAATVTVGGTTALAERTKRDVALGHGRSGSSATRVPGTSSAGRTHFLRRRAGSSPAHEGEARAIVVLGLAAIALAQRRCHRVVHRTRSGTRDRWTACVPGLRPHGGRGAGVDWSACLVRSRHTSTNDGTEPAVLERRDGSRRRSRDGARRSDDRRARS